MGIIDEIYEGKLDLSVPPEQLVLENDLVELLPCLPEKSDREAWVELCIDQGKTVGMILQQMLKLKADDEFNISKLMGALDNEDGMHLSIEESVVGEIEKDSSFCFDPSDDAVIDEISQWVSESVWPPILNRFKLDRSEFIRKLVGEIGKSLDCDPPSAAGWCDFSMIDFAAAEFMDESLGSGVSIYSVQFTGRPWGDKKEIWINCEVTRCHAHCRSIKVCEFAQRLYKDHGPADDNSEDEDEE